LPRQRRYFYYLTGCPLPDCHLIYDLQTSKSTLFIPPVDPESVIWSGLPVTKDEALKRWEVDEVRYVADVNASLTHFGTSTESVPKTTVFAIPEQVSDHITFLEFDDKNLNVLKEAIDVARVVKTEYEVALIAKANEVSAEAHTAALRKIKHAKNEREIEAVFLGTSIAKGARNQAYPSIVASGRAAATLHYLDNNAPTEGKLNLLLDAGAEWDCYASDIVSAMPPSHPSMANIPQTRTFPINGKFTKESRAIYDIVLKMQTESIDALKEGVLWDDVHLLAHKIAIDGLLSIGILKGSPEEILRQRTSVAFFPHGLGHYLGMDTHDTGGNPNYADKDTIFRYLRVRGTLPAGSVITVEPGVGLPARWCEYVALTL